MQCYSIHYAQDKKDSFKVVLIPSLELHVFCPMEDGWPASNGVSGQAMTTIYHVMYTCTQINANSTTYMYTLHQQWHVIFTLSCIPAVKTTLWLHVIDAGCLTALDWDGSVETWKQHVCLCTQWLMQCTFNNLQILHAMLWQPQFVDIWKRHIVSYSPRQTNGVQWFTV